MRLFPEDLVRFVKLGRLHFLVAGFLLYLLGALFAVSPGSPFDMSRFFLGYVVLAAGHLSVSYSNDYYDYEADLRSEKGLFSGGSRILVERPALRPAARWFSLFLIALSLLLGAVFAIVYAMPPAYIALVVFGNLLGWYYTAPPLRLVYRGLGEIATVVGIGFVVPCAGSFSMGGALTRDLAAFLVPLLLYALYFIIGVEIPDANADAAAGKSTLVARRGARFGFVVIALAAMLATACIAILSSLSGLGYTGPALLFSLVPLAPAIYGLIARPAGRAHAEKLIGVDIGSLIALVLLLDLSLVYVRL